MIDRHRFFLLFLGGGGLLTWHPVRKSDLNRRCHCQRGSVNTDDLLKSPSRSPISVSENGFLWIEEGGRGNGSVRKALSYFLILEPKHRCTKEMGKGDGGGGGSAQESDIWTKRQNEAMLIDSEICSFWRRQPSFFAGVLLYHLFSLHTARTYLCKLSSQYPSATSCTARAV